MNNRPCKNGFTLVEILVAVGIIAAIISMVYGTFLATTKASERYKSRITLYQQERKALSQIARQIRGAYAGLNEEPNTAGTSAFQSTKIINAGKIRYFEGNLDTTGGEIMHIVTTNGIFIDQKPVDGLFEVAYKLDKSSGTLFRSQGRFIRTSIDTGKKIYWQPIADNIENIKLTFFDGQQWLNNWDFNDKRKLPFAVKISISCEDENHRKYFYDTVAYIPCRKNRDTEMQLGTLVSVNKQ